MCPLQARSGTLACCIVQRNIDVFDVAKSYEGRVQNCLVDVLFQTANVQHVFGVRTFPLNYDSCALHHRVSPHTRRAGSNVLALGI